MCLVVCSLMEVDVVSLVNKFNELKKKNNIFVVRFWDIIKYFNSLRFI